MRVAVIGAGIVGVTTAHELAARGAEVHVFERRSSVAAETSFANAGVVAPGYVTPWAAPGMPRKVLTQLFSRDAAVRFNLPSALRNTRIGPSDEPWRQIGNRDRPRSGREHRCGGELGYRVRRVHVPWLGKHGKRKLTERSQIAAARRMR